MFYLLSRSCSGSCTRKHHLERVSKHLKDVCETLGLNKIETPVNVQDLTNIEKLFNVSIKPIQSFKSDIYPIRITKSTASKHIDLLVTTNSKTNHYVWIRDFNKLCYNKTKCKKQKILLQQLYRAFHQRIYSTKTYEGLHRFE